MTPSLHDVFQLVRPGLPVELVAANRLDWILAIVRRLPAIDFGGLECRLAAGDLPVDCQQGILGTGNEPRLLKTHINASGHCSSPPWHRIGKFCTQWETPGDPFHRHVIGVWLEFDHRDHRSALPEPSVFLSFRQKQPAGSPEQEILPVIEKAVALLSGRPVPGGMRENLHRCIRRRPAGTVVGDTGIMLSRNTDSVRLNVTPVSPSAVGPYLDRIGWDGRRENAERAMAILSGMTDRMTLCLDVGHRIEPNVGLEGFLSGQPPAEPRWAALLDRLVARGLCAPEKRKALLGWCGRTNPSNTPDPWPVHWIARSLLAPSDRFTTVARWLSHVKIVCRPDNTTEAKAYIAFGHQWLRPEKDRMNAHNETAHTTAGRIDQRNLL